MCIILERQIFNHSYYDIIDGLQPVWANIYHILMLYTFSWIKFVAFGNFPHMANMWLQTHVIRRSTYSSRLQWVSCHFCTEREKVLWSAPLDCLAAVCVVLSAASLPAGILICCLHTGTSTQLGVTGLAPSRVRSLFSLVGNGVSFGSRLIRQRWFIRCDLTAGSGLPHWSAVVPRFPIALSSRL